MRILSRRRLGISWAGGGDGDNDNGADRRGNRTGMSRRGRLTSLSSIWINVLIALSTVAIVATGQQPPQQSQHGTDAAFSNGGGGQTGQ